MASKIVQRDRAQRTRFYHDHDGNFCGRFCCSWLGLCLDVSRMYLVRAELQNAADAAALTAARELNGGSAGIDDAIARIIGGDSIANTQGLRAKTGVAIATISFAADLNGAYTPAHDSSDPAVTATAAKAIASTIRFVKVTTQPASTNILFASSVLERVAGPIERSGSGTVGLALAEYATSFRLLSR